MVPAQIPSLKGPPEPSDVPNKTATRGPFHFWQLPYIYAYVYICICTFTHIHIHIYIVVSCLRRQSETRTETLFSQALRKKA